LFSHFSLFHRALPCANAFGLSALVFFVIRQLLRLKAFEHLEQGNALLTVAIPTIQAPQGRKPCLLVYRLLLFICFRPFRALFSHFSLFHRALPCANAFGLSALVFFVFANFAVIIHHLNYYFPLTYG
jgi:hypothetical protein